MGWIFTIVLMGCIVVASIRRAKRQGIWSWQRFGIALGFAAVVCVLVTAPFLLISTESRYFWPVFIAAWVVALGSIVGFAIWARRWSRPVGGDRQ
jgi:hypothetical protein